MFKWYDFSSTNIITHTWLIYCNFHLYNRARKIEINEKKIEILEKANKIYPYNDLVFYELGKAYKELGQLKEPSIFNIILQTINIPASRLVESNLNGADVVIEPIIPSIASDGDFRHARDYISHGEHAARDAIAEIKRRLNS